MIFYRYTRFNLRGQIIMKKNGLSKGKKIGLGVAAVLVIGFFAIPTDTPTDTTNDEPVKVESESKAESKADENTEEKTNTVIYDENGIKISFKGIEKSTLGKDIKLNVENNTENKKMVQVRDLSINGIMIDGLFSVSIESGKKANDGITLLKSYLEENDITEIEEIELKFAIINSDDILDQYNTETIKITI